MKLGFIVDKIPPEFVGGYEERIWGFASGLSKSHEVRVYSSLPTTEAASAQNPRRLNAGFGLIPRRESNRSLGHSALFSLGLLSDPMSEWHPDALIIEAIPYLHLYTMRRWVAEYACPKLLDVAEAWNNTSLGPRLGSRSVAWAVSKLLRAGLGWADRAIVPSSATAMGLHSHYSYDSVDVVPFGIRPLVRAIVRERAPLGPVYDFVTVGRLVPEKRHADFVSALGLLKRRGWTGRAAVVGSGPTLPSLLALASRRGVAAQVDMLGRVSSEDKFSLLGRARAFVLCSEREGQSIATLEAISCGVPAIVAQPASAELFGVSDMVSDGVNGMFFPVGDVARLADCMDLMLSDPALRRNLGSEALNGAKRFEWEVVLRKLEACIESTVESK